MIRRGQEIDSAHVFARADEVELPLKRSDAGDDLLGGRAVLRRYRIIADVVRVMPPSAAAVDTTEPQVGLGKIHEHDDAARISYILVGEQAVAVVAWDEVFFSDVR